MVRETPSTNLFRFALLVCISVLIMIVDFRSHYLQHLRSALATLVTPLHIVATFPKEISERVNIWFISSEGLRSEHEALQTDYVKLKSRLQKLQALERENEALRHLLDAAEKVKDKVLMAELIEVSLDPYTHKILVDRGLRDGTHVGQPVFDPTGVMGQVTQVMPFTSAVTLITDPGHATPVQVGRNGLRAVAFGTGNSDRLRISYLSQIADIRVDDVLLSSGLGGRFPTGYPVAKVISVENDPGEAFLHIEAEPTALIDRSSQVLLVWREEQQSQIVQEQAQEEEAVVDAEQELQAAILEEEVKQEQ